MELARFFTAVFGDSHTRAGLGLCRSIRRHSPDTDLTVYTDHTDLFEGYASEVHRRDFGQLKQQWPDYYAKGRGGRPNVFKFTLFRDMQDRHPGETIVWIDCDMLVFDHLDRYVRDGCINVIAHGRRRDGEIMSCGGGLHVPGDRYVVSGLFALPPGPALDWLVEVTLERPGWGDTGQPNDTIGDQLLVNHLVHRSGMPVHWLTDDRGRIYNLEIGDGLHPRPGDPALRRIKWRRKPVLDGRPIVVWYWIKSQFDKHLDSGFSSFRPSVSRRLRSLYAPRQNSRDSSVNR